MSTKGTQKCVHKSVRKECPQKVSTKVQGLGGMGGWGEEGKEGGEGGVDKLEGWEVPSSQWELVM